MTQFSAGVDREVHKKLAMELYNFAWDLIEKAGRTDVENDIMINAAHASRFHWGEVGTSLNFARGEWLISRVYSLVHRGEPALFHANKSLGLCLEHQLGDFDLGFAYEGMARAYAVLGDTAQREGNISQAKQCAERIEKEEDKSWLLENLATVASLSLPKWKGD